MTKPLTTSDQSRRHRRDEISTVQRWSDLPDGPLHIILTCLCSLLDFISFSSVCRSWRALASSLPSSLTTSLFPPLLLCPTFSRRRKLSRLRVLDPAYPSFSTSLSRHSSKFASFGFLSFSHGHLLRFSQNRIVILNPFTGNEILSPFLPKVPNFSFPSPLLTSPLSSPDCTLLLFIFDTLYYWRIRSPTPPAWSSHHPQVKLTGAVRIANVKGKVYLMDSLDILFVLDLSPELHLRPFAVGGIAQMCISLQRVLVGCDGELLHLLVVPTEELVSVRLEVFQLDSSVDPLRWVKKESLGNWAIFVGHDSRIPGLAVQNPERWGGKSNGVYFATENENGDEPWAVIKLGDEIDALDRESPLNHAKFRRQLSSAWVCSGF